MALLSSLVTSKELHDELQPVVEEKTPRGGREIFTGAGEVLKWIGKWIEDLEAVKEPRVLHSCYSRPK